MYTYIMTWQRVYVSPQLEEGISRTDGVLRAQCQRCDELRALQGDDALLDLLMRARTVLA